MIDSEAGGHPMIGYFISEILSKYYYLSDDLYIFFNYSNIKIEYI